MGISESEVINSFKKIGFKQNHETKKVIEMLHSSEHIYFRKDIGLPEYIRVVVNPELEYTELLELEGVKLNKTELQHGSNMKKFPKRLNNGKKEIHYGRAFNIDSINTLEQFLSALSGISA